MVFYQTLNNMVSILCYYVWYNCRHILLCWVDSCRMTYTSRLRCKTLKEQFGSFFLWDHFFEGSTGWCVGFTFQVGLQGSYKGHFQTLLLDRAVFWMVCRTSGQNHCKGDLLLLWQSYFWLDMLVYNGWKDLLVIICTQNYHLISPNAENLLQLLLMLMKLLLRTMVLRPENVVLNMCLTHVHRLLIYKIVYFIFHIGSVKPFPNHLQSTAPRCPMFMGNFLCTASLYL